MKPPSSLSNPTIETLIAVAGGLLIVIISLASSLLKVARRVRAAEKEQDSQKSPQLTDSTAIAATTQVKTAGGPLAGAATVTGQVINGVSDTAFYLVTSVIIAEAVVILYLLFNLRRLVRQQAAVATPPWSFAKWWAKVNRFRPITQEADLDLGHDYDGIRELDNRLPPWWLYGFYLTIIFAGVYLWRYHIAHSAPLPAEEYQIAVREAEVKKAAFLKATANNVDENTVKLLTGRSDLDSGKAIFQGVCFACHGKYGEGGVGPNLTDKYWLHGGTVNEVFKSIKYGWPEKGMKSWKDDYSPQQIAQLASYVKSLAGTNPPNA
ncbi:MAG TPA: cbb3-type cytochrome c oxidase N-terminal domain-containing protein, partial [Puia sp.]|nr:cbb3-type cytochrome c oxidase N-terminal domain-containing protein [Puia sp.]